MKSREKVWCLLGRKSGDNAQVLTLASALGVNFAEKSVLAKRWELLVHLQPGGTLAGIDRARSSDFAPPWPDIVITAGRRNEPVAHWIRRQSAGRAKLIHIGRPWTALESWDLIVTTPQYFLPQLPHILVNSLPLHMPATAQKSRGPSVLDAAVAAFPRPYIAVLAGGDSGQFVMTGDKAETLARRVSALAAAVGGSLLVTDTARTPAAARAMLQGVLREPHYYYQWAGAGENPYRDILGMADAFVVTGESMSMLADAALTGKPLLVFDLAEAPGFWWLRRHNYGIKPLSHRLAMRFAPRRMRRDVGKIQQALVAAGQAHWLREDDALNAALLRTLLADTGQRTGADPAQVAARDLVRTVTAARQLLPDP